MDTWCAEKVAEWLSEVQVCAEGATAADKYPALREGVIDEEIEGDALAALTKEDLDDLGVHKMGHRLKILTAIKRAASTVEPNEVSTGGGHHGNPH